MRRFDNKLLIIIVNLRRKLRAYSLPYIVAFWETISFEFSYYITFTLVYIVLRLVFNIQLFIQI